MFVCLCEAVTSARVAECVAEGARSSKDVSEACAAGSVCGRCKATIRSIIEAALAPSPDD